MFLLFFFKDIVNLKVFQVNFSGIKKKKKMPALRSITVRTPAFLSQFSFGEVLTYPFNCCPIHWWRYPTFFKAAESVILSLIYFYVYHQCLGQITELFGVGGG